VALHLSTDGAQSLQFLIGQAGNTTQRLLHGNFLDTAGRRRGMADGLVGDITHRYLAGNLRHHPAIRGYLAAHQRRTEAPGGLDGDHRSIPADRAAREHHTGRARVDHGLHDDRHCHRRFHNSLPPPVAQRCRRIQTGPAAADPAHYSLGLGDPKVGVLQAGETGIRRILSVLAVVTLRQDAVGADTDSLTNIGTSLVAAKNWTFLLGPGFADGIGTGMILGWLMFRSGLVGRRMALVGLVGGAMLATSGAAVLLGVIPQGGAVQGIATIPEIVWEAFLGLYLLFKDFKPSPVSAISRRRCGCSRATSADGISSGIVGINSSVCGYISSNRALFSSADAVRSRL